MSPDHRSEPDQSEADKAEAALADKYVRENIEALGDIGCGRPRLDGRTGAALCRRHLVWEQPAGHWHLTTLGSQVLEMWYAQYAAARGGEHDGE